ncbi:MAG TPA: flagellar biosynthesis protein FliQ [Candidatus Sulfotelmatobacter sp.]|nr:flagellar biosynthesis protein FliQ [Candidatus Sulfotelmatobacter sp.]
MNEADTIEIAREAILVLLQVSGPLMLISLAVGLLVSVFQVVTQVQEMTLTFVPKIVILFVSLLVLLPFMLQSLSHFTERLMDRIIALG